MSDTQADSIQPQQLIQYMLFEVECPSALAAYAKDLFWRACVTQDTVCELMQENHHESSWKGMNCVNAALSIIAEVIFTVRQLRDSEVECGVDLVELLDDIDNVIRIEMEVYAKIDYTQPIPNSKDIQALIPRLYAMVDAFEG